MDRAVAKKRKRQEGFTLLEVMIAIVVITVGLMAILASFAMAVGTTGLVQQDEIARQKATEAFESIFTARATNQITYAQIQNVPNGIFTAGPTPLMGAGPDGLDGTADDGPQPGCPGVYQCVILPGPDGVLGTADDVTMSLSYFTRTITISPVPAVGGGPNPNLRQITVTVSYATPPGGLRDYTIQGLISPYR
ncbi:MAG TPA: prepilin-type N-terminal cleavage/methylation domain-containing protein [Terriglobales bacterium]|nr:prepilin-type N-terminal cleavage/methylation domain-containing protein [Terriglobales bacterium]